MDDWTSAVPTTGTLTPYHNGSTKRDDTDKAGRPLAPPVEERMVIAWDMEGMNLNGDDRPQLPVLFGSSTGTVLVDKHLSTELMLGLIIHEGRLHPHAIHVGYGFRYDANMLVQDLATHQIIRLYKDGALKLELGGKQYRIKWVPGKIFQVTEYGAKRFQNITVTIYDYSSFFHAKFIDTCEQILGDKLTDEDRNTIEHGKAERGQNLWEDIDGVKHYWKAEIQLMRRVFETFRDVMCRAGFALKEWYGPGALARFIIAREGMLPHMAGGQVTGGIMPAGVHAASKHAFFGGHFEPYKVGHVGKSVSIIDINSAYPYALTLVPSLAEGTGEWVHVDYPQRIEEFGFYRIKAVAGQSLTETEAMPLPWRDHRGMITFPAVVHGWYASPEAVLVHGEPNVDVIEGWYWQAYGEPEYPWQFLEEMFQIRKRLGKNNLLSLPFKLGPNSIYGKLAQTVGWNREKKLPPKTHALPIAAWITSYCRAMLATAVSRLWPHVIAVETDSVITTLSPNEIRDRMELGDALGDWGIKTYDDMMYLQSGLYHIMTDGAWSEVRSRGLTAAEFPADLAEKYLRGLKANADWPAMELETRPRFLGAGAANARSDDFKALHCLWEKQQREISIGGAGKRMHVPSLCNTCAREIGPWDAMHDLVVVSKSDGDIISAERTMPWEKEHPKEVAEIRTEIEVQDDQLSA
jgi:hypothetical protein